MVRIFHFVVVCFAEFHTNCFKLRHSSNAEFLLIFLVIEYSFVKRKEHSFTREVLLHQQGKHNSLNDAPTRQQQALTECSLYGHWGTQMASVPTYIRGNSVMTWTV